MKINHLTGIAILAATSMALSLTACGDGDDPTPVVDRGPRTDILAPESFTYVCNDDDPSHGTVFPDAQYVISFYPAEKTFDITISGLGIIASEGGGDMVLSALPYRVMPDGTISANVTNVIPDDFPPTMRFDNVNLHCADPSADNTTALADGVPFSLEMETATGIEITVVPTSLICRGTTTVSLPGTADFSSAETTYTIYIAADHTKADLVVSNARFAAAMPSVGDMLFSDLTLSLTDGGYTLTSASLIPTIAGVPYPSFAISNLEIDVDLSEDADIEFDCGALGRSYHVEADDLTILVPPSH